jgi:hypothetical protein
MQNRFGLLSFLIISTLPALTFASGGYSAQPSIAPTTSAPLTTTTPEPSPLAKNTAEPLVIATPLSIERLAPADTSAAEPAPTLFGGQCPKNTASHWQKSLLVMAFPRLTPTTASAGELYQVEQVLPQLLGEQLVNQRSTQTPVQLEQALPLADSSNPAQLSQLTQRLANQHHSQFMLSGEIIDMAMTRPSATYNPGLYEKAANSFFDAIETKNRFDKRERLFSFQLHLRDGFTGQELLFKRYHTTGIWGLSGRVGFGSPQFWQSDYGQKIKSLVNTAAQELAAAINCQPFIAQIEGRPGQPQFILQSGTNNGLHTGDKLSLYQRIIQGSETHYQEQDTRMINRNLAIEVREAYPTHSVAVINGSPYLTGQLLAVAP